MWGIWWRMSDGFSLVITPDLVRELVSRQGELRAEMEQIGAKLAAIRVLAPEASDIIGQADRREAPLLQHPGSSRVRAVKPVTELVAEAMAGEKGGRDVAWLRAKLFRDSEVAERLSASPTSISNAVGRLVERGRLRKAGRLYYMPDILRKIRAGEIEEEQVENVGVTTFNGVMHLLMERHGKPFTAADALALAQTEETLADRIKEQPSRVYSWLSRELGKRKLVRDGDHYRYPSQQDEAPNGKAASASFNFSQKGGDGHDPATT